MMKGRGCRLVRGRPAAASVVPAPTVVPIPTGAAAVVIVIRRLRVALVGPLLGLLRPVFEGDDVGDSMTDSRTMPARACRTDKNSQVTLTTLEMLANAEAVPLSFRIGS